MSGYVTASRTVAKFDEVNPASSKGIRIAVEDFSETPDESKNFWDFMIRFERDSAWLWLRGLQAFDFLTSCRSSAGLTVPDWSVGSVPFSQDFQ